MTNYFTFAEFNILCAIITLILLINGLKRRNGKVTENIFSGVLISVFFSFLLDAIWGLVNDGLLQVSWFTANIINVLYFISAGIISFLYIAYTRAMLERNLFENKKSLAKVCAPFAVYFVMVILSPCFGWIFSIGPNNEYSRGPLYLYQALLCYGGALVAATEVYLISLIKKDEIKARELKITGSLVIAPIIGGVLQIFLEALPMLAIGLTVGLLTTYLTLQGSIVMEELQIEKNRADDANRAKSQFLARMSHEIRTPINAIMGMNEMILRSAADEEILSAAKDIKSSSILLLQLINEILDINRLESGKVALVPAQFDAVSLYRDILTMTKGRMWETGLELKINIDPNIPKTLYGDAVKLRQIYVNLITNSIKYTKNGSVSISVTAEQNEKGCMLKSSIADTGIGIKQEDMENLFVAFERIDESNTAGIEGAGLGLNITKSFLMMMGSDLQVQSEYGKGTCMSFDVQLEVIDSTPMGEVEAEESQGTVSYKSKFEAADVQILLIDDNKINRKVFRSLLRDTKMQIDEGDSGFACLEMIAEKRYDIIFLDHMMPEMDGVETFYKMKASHRNKCAGVPIIMLTANAIEGAEQDYLAMGFDGFISKPIDSDKLEEMIVEILGK